MPLSSLVVSALLVASVGALRQLTLFKANRRGDWSQSCKPFPHQRVVLVTVNGDYMSMYKNWLFYAKPFLKSTEHLYVVAEDAQAADELSAMRENDTTLNFTLVTPEDTEKVEHTQLASSLLEQEAPFGSDAYGAVVVARPARLLTLLSQGCTTLYVDIDTVWVKDPFNQIGAAAPSALYLTDDGQANIFQDILVWLRLKTINYCTCLLYMHPTPANIELLERWAMNMRQGGKITNQKAFNIEWTAMSDAKPVTAVLPEAKFPPGRIAKYYPKATVYHANWRVGQRAKVEFFEERNMWTQEPSSHFKAAPPQPSCVLPGCLFGWRM